MNDNFFGLFIQSRRNELKLTLRQAGKLIGISHSHLGNLEHGFDPRTGAILKPRLEVIKLISEGYELEYNYLLSLAGFIESSEQIQYNEKSSVDIQFAISELLSKADKEYTLMLSGEEIDKEDWEFVKDILEITVDTLKKKLIKDKHKRKS